MTEVHELGIVLAWDTLWAHSRYRYRGDSNNLATAWGITFLEPKPAKLDAFLFWEGMIFELYADHRGATVADVLRTVRIVFRVPGGTIEIRQLSVPLLRAAHGPPGEELADYCLEVVGAWRSIVDRRKAAHAEAALTDRIAV